MSSKNEIFEKTRAIIAEKLNLEEETITPESSILEDLGADSLDIVDLVMALEEEFDIQVPDEDMENLTTVGDVVNYIARRLSAEEEEEVQ